MIINFEGHAREFDRNTISLKQGLAIHKAFGLTISEYYAALRLTDPRGLTAAYWLMLQQARDTTSLADVDCDAIAFYAAYVDALAAEADADGEPDGDDATVPTSPPSDAPASPGPAIPTATTPQPLDPGPDLTGY